MSNLVKHAKKELELAGLFEKDGMYNGGIGVAVLEMIELFSSQGHSGMSASIVRGVFSELADFKPITPLRGIEKEWTEAGQNKRCSAVFKDDDGGYSYLDALTFKNQEGNYFTGSAIDKNGERVSSRQKIKFPFAPKTFIIDVKEKELSKNDWEFYVKDQKQLDEALKYFKGE